MSLLSRLFGKGGGTPDEAAEPETYEGFRIFPDPIKEAGGHRIAARIELGDLRVNSETSHKIGISLEQDFDHWGFALEPFANRINNFLPFSQWSNMIKVFSDGLPCHCQAISMEVSRFEE